MWRRRKKKKPAVPGSCIFLIKDFLKLRHKANSSDWWSGNRWSPPKIIIIFLLFLASSTQPSGLIASCNCCSIFQIHSKFLQVSFGGCFLLTEIGSRSTILLISPEENCVGSLLLIWKFLRALQLVLFLCFAYERRERGMEVANSKKEWIMIHGKFCQRSVF